MERFVSHFGTSRQEYKKGVVRRVERKFLLGQY